MTKTLNTETESSFIDTELEQVQDKQIKIRNKFVNVEQLACELQEALGGIYGNE